MDDNLLAYQFEDNMKIEPEWYCPILPMVLVNGCEGIGTGFSTNVPNYDVREIVTNLKALLAGRPATDMVGVVSVELVAMICGEGEVQSNVHEQY